MPDPVTPAIPSASVWAGDTKEGPDGVSDEREQTGRAVRVVVAGRVQGVGFRAWTQREARELDLAGWVRNRPEGDVEALLQGPPDSVQRMLERLRRGPALSRVDRLEAQDLPWEDGLHGFHITA